MVATLMYKRQDELCCREILVYQSLRRSFVEAATSTFDKSIFYTQTSSSFVQVEGLEVQITESGVRLQVKFWLSHLLAMQC